jgi:modulator of FtsH protease
VVVFSLLALAPGQAPATLGIEMLALALPLGLASYLLIGRALRARDLSAHRDLRQLVAAAGTLPFAVAGVSLIAESGGGLYWLLAGTVLALIGAVLNAWVLLVEILR